VPADAVRTDPARRTPVIVGSVTTVNGRSTGAGGSFGGVVGVGVGVGVGVAGGFDGAVDDGAVDDGAPDGLAVTIVPEAFGIASAAVVSPAPHNTTARAASQLLIGLRT
jgi:hypothetical protein